MTGPSDCPACLAGAHGECEGPVCPCPCPWNRPVDDDEEGGCTCLTCYPGPVPDWARPSYIHSEGAPA